MVRGGLPEYVIKHQASDERIWTTIFWANTVLAVIVIGITWLIATPAAWLFEVPELEAVLRALSLMLLVRALGATHEALMIRTFGFKALALRTLVASLIGGAVGIAMALTGFGVWSLSSASASPTASAGTVLVCGSRARWRPRGSTSPWALSLRISPFGRPLTMQPRARRARRLRPGLRDRARCSALRGGVGFCRIAIRLRVR